MLYYVYRITCTHPTSSEKYYYGFRGAINPQLDTYWGSSKYVNEAMKKFGRKFFTKKIVRVFDNRHDAISLEMKLHEKFNVDTNPIFFNRCKQTVWGFNCTGATVKGKTYEELYGSEKASELKKHRAMILERTMSTRDYSGDDNPNFGNRWSPEMKATLSEKVRGEKHVSYGSIWINDGKTEQKIKGMEIPSGWSVGRMVKDHTKVREEFTSSGLSRKKFAEMKQIPYTKKKKYLRGL